MKKRLEALTFIMMFHINNVVPLYFSRKSLCFLPFHGGYGFVLRGRAFLMLSAFALSATARRKESLRASWAVRDESMTERR